MMGPGFGEAVAAEMFRRIAPYVIGIAAALVLIGVAFGYWIGA